MIARNGQPFYGSDLFAHEGRVIVKGVEVEQSSKERLGEDEHKEEVVSRPVLVFHPRAELKLPRVSRNLLAQGRMTPEPGSISASNSIHSAPNRYGKEPTP